MKPLKSSFFSDPFLGGQHAPEQGVNFVGIYSLDFIFKGGTSLILLMEKPLRFSVDIDIIVRPDLKREELEGYLSQIVMNSKFLRMEVDEKRSYKEEIPKAHYKFIYRSNVSTRSKAGKIVDNP